MKEEDCDNTQIFYPKTKRCIKRDTKKAIEYLFNKGDPTIQNIYEKVDGKIIKRCVRPKIRNPDTKRCIKSKNIPSIKKVLKVIEKKKVSVSLNKKIEAIKKVKKALSPFVNRVSADIYHRNKYLMLMRRELKKYNTNNKGCLKVYKQYPDKSYSYRIGNRIILKKRIGTDSVYGIVYLSEFREKEKKVFTYASKIYQYVEKKAKMELEILNKMSDLVRMDMCPHFPLLYGYVICDNIVRNKDSFIKSDKKDKSVSQNMLKFPILIRENMYSKIITTFNELANGDLWNFLKLYETNIKFLVNAIIQQFLSIMFFNYHMKRVHMDAHPGNFLYHKIKAGGYFHYELFGVDYYLENIGILWVIWDFDLSKTYKEAMDIYKYKKNYNDYLRILAAYLPAKYLGYCRSPTIYNNTSLLNFTYKIYYHQREFFNKKLPILSMIKNKFKNEKEEGYNENSLKEYIFALPVILSTLKVDGKTAFLTELPAGATIINKKPYTLTRGELFKK